MGEELRDKSLMRNLGAFVGHIWRAVKADPAGPASGEAAPRRVVEVRREVEEEHREMERGEVTLRRTTIEEIEINRPKKEG